MPMKTPNDLLIRELKEISSAERQLSRALPKLAKAVSVPSLREMLSMRREQGAALLESIDQALEEIGTTKARPKNIVVEAAIEDINQDMDEISDPKMQAAALIGGIQKIQHYCIAAWGTAAEFGRVLEVPMVVETMQRVLDEGKRFDEQLTQLARDEINPAMLQQEEEDEESGSSQRQSRSRAKEAASAK